MEHKYQLSDAESTDESAEGTERNYDTYDKELEDTDDDTDDDDDEEDKFWDIAVSKVYVAMHKKFESTCNRLSEIHPEKAVEKLEKKAFLDLKSKYSSDLRKYCLSFLELMTVLRKDAIQ